MAWRKSLLSASSSARAKVALALLRLISAIFSFKACRLALAILEPHSSVFHVVSLVAAKVSKASCVCSMLVFIRSRSDCGRPGAMNALLAASRSCPPACPRLPSGGHGGVKLFGIWLAAFCSASSHVLAGHHAAHQK